MREPSALSARVLVCSKWKITTSGFEHIPGTIQTGMYSVTCSIDRFPIIMEMCRHRLKKNHTGGTSKQTARSYNLTCNHRRKLLYTTGGYPSR